MLFPILRKVGLMAGFSVSLIGSISPLSGDEIINLDPFRITAMADHSGEALSRDALGARPSSDVAGLLGTEVPGVHLSRRGALAGDVVIRGFSRDNLAIELDGGCVFGACPNRMDPPIFHVGTAEVGQLTVLYGPYAVDRPGMLGGAIEVETISPPDGFRAELQAFAGSHGLWGGGASVSGGTTRPEGESEHALLAVSYRQGELYEDGDGRPVGDLAVAPYRPGAHDGRAFGIADVLARVEVSRGRAEVSAFIGYQSANDILYPGLRMDADYDRTVRGGLKLKIMASTALWDRWEVNLLASDVDHLMVDNRRGSSSPMNPMLVANPMLAEAVAQRGYFMITDARSSVAQGDLRARKQLEAFTLEYGIDYRLRKWDADNVVGPNVNDMIPEVETHETGLWLTANREKERSRLEAGLRLNFAVMEALGDVRFLESSRGLEVPEPEDFELTGYVRYARQLQEGFRLSVGTGTGVRIPDPQERFINLNRPGTSVDWVGNPSLEPVRLWQADVEGSYQQERWSVAVRGFYGLVDNWISLAPVSLANGGRGSSYEGIEARLFGAELNGQITLREDLRADFGVAWTRGEKRSQPTGGTDDDLAEMPPVKGRLALSWQRGDILLRAELIAAAEADAVDRDVGETPLDGWAVVNLFARYAFAEHYEVRVAVDNLLDEAYTMHHAYTRDPFSTGVALPEPGRTFYVSVAARF